MKQREKIIPLIVALVIVAALAGFALERKKGLSDSAAQADTAETSTSISQTVLLTASPSAKPEEKSAADSSKEDADDEPADSSGENAEEGSSEENTAADTAKEETTDEPATDSRSTEIDEYGEYTSKEEVALYIHTYGRLPSNYITKKEAEDLGWGSGKGNLWEIAPGKSIGGSKFGNREGHLPDGNYKECDINYEGGYRGPERLVYSEDGRIYYTEDHYNTFEQMY